MIANYLVNHGFHISMSAGCANFEYERTSTTVVNAVSPILKDLSPSQRSEGIHLRVMQSNGGMTALKKPKK
jgi:N-methylhydantoinase A/oxoprolinase/acetone carboxylase beta subunit